jgi:hypothetical protein
VRRELIVLHFLSCNGDRMRRRDFIASLMAAATTQVAVAEEPTKTYRLAIVGVAFPVAEAACPSGVARFRLPEFCVWRKRGTHFVIGSDPTLRRV